MEMHFSMQCVNISIPFWQLQGIINYMCQLIRTINNKYVYTTKKTKHITTTKYRNKKTHRINVKYVHLKRIKY